MSLLIILQLYVILMTSSMTRAAPTGSSHPCDDVINRGKYVCDPARGGTHYFYCNVGGGFYDFSCPSGLVFKNSIVACDWNTPSYTCETSSGSAAATTTTTTTTTPTTTTARTTTTPTTTTTARTTTTPATTSTRATTATTTTRSPMTNVTTTKAVSSNPCQGKADGTLVCNPANGGQSFFACNGGVTTMERQCVPGLRFDNTIEVCDWATNNPYCPSSGEDTGSTGGGDGGQTNSVSPLVTWAPPAGPCNANNCQLPNCRCLGTTIPGGLNVAEVPQMVILTFDDDINPNNINYYEKLYPNDPAAALKNPNGCRTTGTFFVSNSWTVFSMVVELSNKGNEMASHSLDHSNPTGWDKAMWAAQIEGQRENFVSATGLPAFTFPGMRSPYLVLGGEKQFSMLADNAFGYDSSMLGGSFMDDGAAPVWPFTLDYPPVSSTAMCDQGNCPVNSYPGLWEVPIVRQYTTSGTPCSMSDDCGGGIPASATKEQVKAYLRHNFNRHFQTNRSPYMISLHATWFSNVPSSFGALQEFLAEVNAMPEVWMVSVKQMLDWMRNPKPLSQVYYIPSWRCT